MEAVGYAGPGKCFSRSPDNGDGDSDKGEDVLERGEAPSGKLPCICTGEQWGDRVGCWEDP